MINGRELSLTQLFAKLIRQFLIVEIDQYISWKQRSGWESNCKQSCVNWRQKKTDSAQKSMKGVGHITHSFLCCLRANNFY